jgi:hypothetical protein
MVIFGRLFAGAPSKSTTHDTYSPVRSTATPYSNPNAYAMAPTRAPLPSPTIAPTRTPVPAPTPTPFSAAPSTNRAGDEAAGNSLVDTASNDEDSRRPSAITTPVPAQQTRDAGSALTAAAADDASASHCTQSDAPAHVITQAEPVAHADALGIPSGTSIAVAVQLGADGRETDAVVQTPGATPAVTTAVLDVARRSTYAGAIRGCAQVSGTAALTVRF